METVIFHVCRKKDWEVAQLTGSYSGPAEGNNDNFIHFSDSKEVFESVEKHFSGCSDLILLTVRTELLGSALKWERSRGGKIFPHLYSSLPLKAVVEVQNIDVNSKGQHIFDNLKL